MKGFLFLVVLIITIVGLCFNSGVRYGSLQHFERTIEEAARKGLQVESISEFTNHLGKLVCQVNLEGKPEILTRFFRFVKRNTPFLGSYSSPLLSKEITSLSIVRNGRCPSLPPPFPAIKKGPDKTQPNWWQKVDFSFKPAWQPAWIVAALTVFLLLLGKCVFARA